MPKQVGRQRWMRLAVAKPEGPQRVGGGGHLPGHGSATARFNTSQINKSSAGKNSGDLEIGLTTSQKRSQLLRATRGLGAREKTVLRKAVSGLPLDVPEPRLRRRGPWTVEEARHFEMLRSGYNPRALHDAVTCPWCWTGQC